MRVTQFYFLAVLGAVVCGVSAATGGNETSGWCVQGGDKCKPVMKESDGNSYQYDLSALGKQVLKVEMDDKEYFVSVCGSVLRGCKSGTSVCQLDNEAGYRSCGALATQKWSTVASNEPGTGLTVEYTGGAACDDGSGTQRKSTLTLMCDRTEEGRLVDVLASSCEYFFTVLSKHACGTRHTGGDSGSDTPGGRSGADTAALVILILLLVAVAVYFVGGAVYQKKVHDPQSPREYVIHNGFWCALPGMVVDGCKFIVHGCKKGDYVSV